MASPLLPARLGVGLVYVVSAVIALTLVPRHPQLGIAVAFDLTVTAAAVFWLLAVRPGHARPAALIRVLVLGLALARLLVGISALGIAAIAIEAVVVALLVIRLRRIVRRVRALRREGHGLPAALDVALRDVIPARAVASVLATEVALVILAITGWFRSPPEGFAMHRRSGYVLTIGVLAALAVVEGVLTHVVVSRFAPTLAIVLSALSAYSLLWLVGMAQAARLSPLRITERGLVVERGATRRAFVPHELVASATPITAPIEGAADLSYVEPNVLLTLHAPVEVHRLFRRPTTATQLLLSLDDRDAFLARVAQDRGTSL